MKSRKKMQRLAGKGDWDGVLLELANNDPMMAAEFRKVAEHIRKHCERPAPVEPEPEGRNA